MPYYLIVAFQAFCIYHLFKNRNDYYWIFAIVFLPVVGCIIYLITQVIKKRDADKIQESLITVINPTKKVKDLERKLQFAETYLNRVNLADAYISIKDYPNAISHYKKALEDTAQNDFHVSKQLILSYFFHEDYEKVVAFSEQLKQTSEFKKAQLQFVYGLSLEHLGRIDEAEEQLKEIDKRYCNYDERLELIQFLIRHDKTGEAKEVLEEVYSEIQHMSKVNQRSYRMAIAEIEKLRNNM